MKKLIFEIREMAGLKFYPLNEDSRLLCQVAKRRCFTTREIEILRELGFPISFEENKERIAELSKRFEVREKEVDPEPVVEDDENAA